MLIEACGMPSPSTCIYENRSELSNLNPSTHAQQERRNVGDTEPGTILTFENLPLDPNSMVLFGEDEDWQLHFPNEEAEWWLPDLPLPDLPPVNSET